MASAANDSVYMGDQRVILYYHSLFGEQCFTVETSVDPEMQAFIREVAMLAWRQTGYKGGRFEIPRDFAMSAYLNTLQRNMVDHKPDLAGLLTSGRLIRAAIIEGPAAGTVYMVYGENPPHDVVERFEGKLVADSLPKMPAPTGDVSLQPRKH